VLLSRVSVSLCPCVPVSLCLISLLSLSGLSRHTSPVWLSPGYQVQEKHRLIKPSDFVIDFGAAPGGWSVVAAKQLKIESGGKLISVDLTSMELIPQANAFFILGDFNCPQVNLRLKEIALGRKADVLLSDVMVNTSGDSDSDHLRSINICFEVLGQAEALLRTGGALLCKFFRGRDDKELLEEAKTLFRVTKVIKPKSSRQESREMYLLCLDKL
jgi:23S rRNA (uridine2552-2'-O)-methyltransferase